MARDASLRKRPGHPIRGAGGLTTSTSKKGCRDASRGSRFHRSFTVIDISVDVEKYLGMTQVCIDVALDALRRKAGSQEAALRIWKTMEREAACRRNEHSIVRWDHGGAR